MGSAYGRLPGDASKKRLRTRGERTARAIHKQFHVIRASKIRQVSQPPGGGDCQGGACVGQVGELELDDFSRSQIYQGQIYISHSSLGWVEWRDEFQELRLKAG